MRARAAVLPLFLFLIEFPLNAQVVRGRVTDYATGEHLRGAAVLLLDEHARAIAHTTTDTTGVFELRAGRAGAYQLNVSLIGYLPFTSGTLSVSSRETVQVRVQIATQPIPVAPVLVTARSLGSSRLAEFERRRTQHGAGHFITQKDIEKRPIASATTLLYGVPGVMVQPIPMGGVASGRNLIAMRGTLAECMANVFVDGMLMSNRVSADDIVIPEWLAGVEVYPHEASAPAEYRRGNGCGVVLFWTRDPERDGRWTLPKVAVAAGMAVFAAALVAR